MAEIPKWVETLISGIIIISALIFMVWMLNFFSGPQAGESAARNLLPFAPK